MWLSRMCHRKTWIFCNRSNFSPVQANYCYWLYDGLAGRSDDRPQILLDQFNLYVFVCMCICECVLAALLFWVDVRKTKEKKKKTTTATTLSTKTNSAKKEPRRKRLWKREPNQDGGENNKKRCCFYFFWSSARSFTPVRHLILPGTPVAMCVRLCVIFLFIL